MTGLLGGVSGGSALGGWVAERAPGPGTLGSGVAAAAAATVAGVTLLGRASGRKNTGGAFEATVTGFAVGTVCLLPMALLEGLVPDMEHAATWTAGLIVYLGAVPTALAYALFFAGLGAVRATTASVVTLVEPLTAAVVGITVLGERPNALVLAGTALLMLAVLFLATDEETGRA
ncbi:DMT family transporter [Streptomyces sp. TG1A-60]|uniref:DMT family transporter n=1 Tax=Streptomyces sp. TG1A-60 TaxID=3129111 RepID=UPI0030CCFED7